MARFGTFNFGEEKFGGESPVTSPQFPSGQERIAWNFFDGVESYDLPTNPSEASMPSMKRNVMTKPTCSGRQVLIEGKPEVGQMQLSGVILTEEEFRAFEHWVAKRKQVRVTDDLGKKYWIYFKSFAPQRVKNDANEWHHTYTITGVQADRG